MPTSKRQDARPQSCCRRRRWSYKRIMSCLQRRNSSQLWRLWIHDNSLITGQVSTNTFVLHLFVLTWNIASSRLSTSTERYWYFWWGTEEKGAYKDVAEPRFAFENICEGTGVLLWTIRFAVIYSCWIFYGKHRLLCAYSKKPAVILIGSKVDTRQEIMIQET